MNKPDSDHMQYRAMVLDRIQDDSDTIATEMQVHINKHTNIPGDVRLDFVYAFLKALKKTAEMIVAGIDEIHADYQNRERDRWNNERERWHNELSHQQQRIEYMEALARRIEKGKV